MRAVLYRILYSALWWCITPLALLRLWWRGRKEPGYRQHIPERFGFYCRQKQIPSRILWVHAVSVGETRAAEPLIYALLDAYPQHTVLLTHMTATGRATGQSLFGASSRVMQSYLPYDTGTMVARFLRHFSPQICLLIETEVWPNLIAQCKRFRLPVALVNARLSERSLRRGKKFSTLMTDAARGIACVGAQTHADAARLQQLGAANVHVTGNIKFDVKPSKELLTTGVAMRRQIGERPVLVCASTREGEEALILDAYKAIEPQIKDLLLIIVPRHPQRFDEVAELIAAHRFTSLRRSELGYSPLDTRCQILLGDSMGEMFAYYAAADVVFIGGSLLPLGGQNLIEACAVAKPVLIGMHTFNFAVATEQAITVGAALRVADANAMLDAAQDLLSHPDRRAVMSQHAVDFWHQHSGATKRTMFLLAALLNQK